MTIFDHYLAMTMAFFEHLGADAQQALAHYVSIAEPILDQYGYPAIFGAVAVEGFGIPAPGQTLLMTGSMFAARGDMSVACVSTLAFVAAVLGNSLGYLLGRWGGRLFLAKVGVNEQRLMRIETLFNRYGGGVVLLGRFFEGLRQLSGIVAGALEMPFWRFSLFNVFGAALWVAIWGLGVYYLEHNIHALFAVFQRLEPYLIALTLMALVCLLIYLRRVAR